MRVESASQRGGRDPDIEEGVPSRQGGDTRPAAGVSKSVKGVVKLGLILIGATGGRFFVQDAGFASPVQREQSSPKGGATCPPYRQYLSNLALLNRRESDHRQHMKMTCLAAVPGVLGPVMMALSGVGRTSRTLGFTGAAIGATALASDGYAQQESMKKFKEQIEKKNTKLRGEDCVKELAHLGGSGEGA